MHRAAWSSAFLALAMISTGCNNTGEEGCVGEPTFATDQCCATPSGPQWIDVIGNTSHCGSCGFTCSPGQTCRLGMCEGTVTGDGGMTSDGGMCTASPSCSSSQFCCLATCVTRAGTAIGSDGRTDPSFSNCGFCGRACDPERASSCSVRPPGTAAECTCGAFAQCAAGQVCARSGTDFACVNTSTDPNNCGSVGHACGANEDCIAGTCTPRMCGADICDATETCCASTCVDTQTDAANCGGCGMACQAGESCTAGMCRCGTDTCARPMPSPLPGLPGGTCGEICCADTCVPQGPANCGGCGTTCGGADECGQATDIFGMTTTPVGCLDPEMLPFTSVFSECAGELPPDAGTPDAGPSDAGPSDAGSEPDAGVSP